MDKLRKKIVVDAMGGDFAPNSEVEGGLLALQDSINKSTSLSIVYVGVYSKIKAILDNYEIDNKSELLKKIEIINATEVITMHDDPIFALKTKADSSMVKGLKLLQTGKADGYISAGNTGATLTLATIILGRIDGVSRPTIGAFIPTSKKKPIFLVDIGATVECRARFLYEYAVMGSVLVHTISGIENPSIGLLNVGEESSKGTTEHIEAYKKLKESNLNFLGNIEGGDILIKKTDVVVTDGYAGNIILKFAESILTMFNEIIADYSKTNIDKSEQIKSTIPFLMEILSGFNSEKAGGVPLLGVKGNVIIGHGNSSAKAIKNMIIECCNIIEKDLCKKIELELKK